MAAAHRATRPCRSQHTAKRPGRATLTGCYRLLQPITCMLVSLLWWGWAAAQTDCRPAPSDVARLVEIRPGFHRVDGPLAEFDPCHRSAQLSLPGMFASKLAEKPPLMIIAHGGNGPGAAEQEMVRRMNAQGVATLLYDAYEMNGFRYRGTTLFLTGTTNESRQRMIFKATLGAYQWARQHRGIDTSRIFIHGLSNGGSVALNMAAVVDPEHVKAVFAEGPSPTGIGMPDAIKVPLKLVFGKIDNYGGKTEDDWMYTRTDPCAFNQASPLAAPGTAQRCSATANPSDMTISPKTWGEQLRSAGHPVEFWFYDNAAHGLLAGPIDRGIRVYGSGPTAQRRYGWIGASPDAANRFVDDLMKTVKATYPSKAVSQATGLSASTATGV
jgi:dienelactone hydrolase